MHITAKQAAKLIGISKTAVINALDKHTLSGQKNEEGEWLVDAADANRYRDARQHKTERHRQVVDGLKANVDSGLQEKLEAQNKVISQLEQRVMEQQHNFNLALEAKEETIQTLRLLTDQSAAALTAAKEQLPPDVVEKMAALEAENRLLKDEKAAREKRLQEQLAQKAKAEADAAAAKAARDALPFWKKIIG